MCSTQVVRSCENQRPRAHEERGTPYAEREGAGGSWTTDSGRFRDSEGLPGENFCEGELSMREKLNVRRLRVRSPLVNFFFHSKVCMPHGGEPFCGGFTYFDCFCFVCSFFLLHCVVLKRS